jgi:hypothetical protein
LQFGAFGQESFMTSRAKTNYHLRDLPRRDDGYAELPKQLDLRERQPVEQWQDKPGLRVVTYGMVVAFCYIGLFVLFGITTGILIALALSAACICVTVIMLLNSIPR